MRFSVSLLFLNFQFKAFLETTEQTALEISKIRQTVQEEELRIQKSIHDTRNAANQKWMVQSFVTLYHIVILLLKINLIR